MSMRCIHHDHIDFGAHQRRYTFIGAFTNTYRRTDPKPSLTVLAGIGFFTGFLDVFNRNQSA